MLSKDCGVWFRHLPVSGLINSFLKFALSSNGRLIDFRSFSDVVQQNVGSSEDGYQPG
jgi:hypothetical protein